MNVEYSVEYDFRNCDLCGNLQQKDDGRVGDQDDRDTTDHPSRIREIPRVDV